MRTTNLLLWVALLGTLILGSCTNPSNLSIAIPNGGRAWTAAVDPGNSQRILAVSETGGLFRSTNQGSNWAQVSGKNTFRFRDVAWNPLDANVAVAVAMADFRVVSGGGIYRSTDGGASWARVAVTSPCDNTISAYAVEWDAGANTFWAGTSCGLARSTDGGQSWTFLSGATGFNNDKTYAFLAPAANQYKILTDYGVKVSTNGGSSWTYSNSGLPGYVAKGVQNQIATSPLNEQHIYWACNSVAYNATEGKNMWQTNLFVSTNNGSSWSQLYQAWYIGRPPWVRTTPSLSGNASQYEVYFGDGGCLLNRATVSNPLAAPSWVALGHDHCDLSDMAFAPDLKTPILLTSDGGLSKTTNNGLNWAMTGAGAAGYKALQITEVTGQQHVGTGNDLYFATQDNFIWASSDNGATWPVNRCCEGFFLNIPRQNLSAGETVLTGVACGACGNFRSGPVLSAQAGWNNPPDDKGNPKLLTPGHYIQNSGTGTFNNYRHTSDLGSHWNYRFSLNETPHMLPTSTSQSNPVLFIPVKLAGTTPSGDELIGLKKVTGAQSGVPMISDVTGFGGLGIFPTEFAWYKPFGVHPRNPDFMIVPDVIDHVMKKTTNGGADWTPMNDLTNLITANGEYSFNQGIFTMVSCFGFDPDCINHILIGTVQNGVMRSTDGGATWAKLPGTDVIPFISSFYFEGNKKVVISSYGRGLWRYTFTDECTDLTIPIISNPVLYPAGPWIRYQGVWIPIRDLNNPDVCPRCGFLFQKEGEIRGYRGGKEGIEEVYYRGSEPVFQNWQGEQMQAPFKLVEGDEMGELARDEEVNQILKNQDIKVHGLYFGEDGQAAPIFSAKPLSPSDLPEFKVRFAPVSLNMDLATGKSYGKQNLITLSAKKFNPQFPFRANLNGQEIDLKQELKFEENGDFSFLLDFPLQPGVINTLTIVQETDQGVVKEIINLHKPVSDGEERERK
ncbi:MAG: hypothetical protein H6581_24330 [Bacteroidia bacterium]|nr:hypothetical protein [Bacteroidia bacterium]